ncbi:MAG: SMI1/KNR4 family protein [Dysgonomonas sp.]
MFKTKEIENILDTCEKREHALSNLSKLSIEDIDYLSFISKYKDCEITPDIRIFGYEEALNANNYITKEYPETAESVWQIGNTGIGDQWFIDKKTQSVLFYDHDQGEYDNSEFIDMEIKFYDFVKMGFLLRSLEDFLDDNTSYDTDIVEKEFRTRMNKISPELYEKYPYNWI